MNTNKSGNTKEAEMNRYICFFQSVLTIGIMTRGADQKEAEAKAVLAMENGNGINYCSFDQSHFEHTATEKWTPEFEPDFASDALSFKFNPDDNTKNVIATRLGKSAAELTDADLEEFVKGSIDMALTQADLDAQRPDSEDK